MTIRIYKSLISFGSKLATDAINNLTKLQISFPHLIEMWFKGNRRKTEIEPQHDKTNNISVRPAKTQISGHPPSLIRVFTVHLIGS